jgi:hypothetical protein
MGDEYTALGVFFAGVVTQALLFARSVAGAMGALSLALLSLGAAFWFTRNEADRAFGLPVMATLLFVLAFACFYRDNVLPRVTAALVLHYTLLGIYALYSFWNEGPMPLWVLGWFAVPILTSVYLLVAPSPGKLSKIVAYASFLILLSDLVGRQMPITRVKEIQDAEGFGLALYSYVFVGGMVFLYLASNAIYLLLLIPLAERRSAFWDGILGGSAADEHAEVVAGKLEPESLSWLAASLLGGHALVLWMNFRLELIAPGVLLNGSILGLGLLAAVRETLVAHPNEG